MDLRDTRPYYVVFSPKGSKIYRCMKDFEYLTKRKVPLRVLKCYSLDEAKACVERNKFAVNKDTRYKFDDTNNYPYAFIDGSFNYKTGVYGWGGFIDSQGTRYLVKGSGNNPEYSKFKSTIGEALGVINIVDRAMELGIFNLVIYFDFAPLETWLFDDCKSSNEIKKLYKEHIDKAKGQGMNLIFRKVEAHKKVRGNCIADMLAKEAVGAKKRQSLPVSFFNVRNTDREYAFVLV